MCKDKDGNERFKVMERKLYKGIMTPSAWATIFFGGWLLTIYSLDEIAMMGWLHLKVTLVIPLVGYHYFCGRLLYRFRNNANKHSHIFYRWFNELPIAVLILIVILTIVKPL